MTTLYALIYHVSDDYMERRSAFRSEHLDLAQAAHERGDLLLGGAFADPADTALLIWRTDGPGPIEAFVASDPYVASGLVKRWEIRPWTVVIGG